MTSYMKVGKQLLLDYLKLKAYFSPNTESEKAIRLGQTGSCKMNLEVTMLRLGVKDNRIKSGSSFSF
jgi:hypothetical protein